MIIITMTLTVLIMTNRPTMTIRGLTGHLLKVWGWGGWLYLGEWSVIYTSTLCQL